MRSKKEKSRRLLWWRGLLENEPTNSRRGVFVALVILSTAMTFMQFGFLGVGFSGHYVTYLFTLLCPIALCALLLGARSGGLQGLIAGIVLYLHSRLQPLDMVEKYLITLVGSAILYAVTGFLLGLLYAWVFRKKRSMALRALMILVINLVICMVFTFVFQVSASFKITFGGSIQSVLAASSMGNDNLQIMCDTLLATLACLLAIAGVRWYEEVRNFISVRTIVRMQLVVSLFLVFSCVMSVSFVAITVAEQGRAYENISGELDYVKTQFNLRLEYLEKFMRDADGVEFDSNRYEQLYNLIEPSELLKGYDLTDGTLVMYLSGKRVYTTNPNFGMGNIVGFRIVDDELEPVTLSDSGSPDELLGFNDNEALLYDEDILSVEELAKTGEMREILYNTDDTDYQLGYMQARDIGEGYVLVFAKPYSLVFESRLLTMHWTSLITFVLLVVVYLLVSTLLKKTVVEPVNRTNEVLFKITQGDLDAVVSEVASNEFASLSAGINTCVFSLKEYAAEAERRIERDLATARAIQEGALPRNFPAFPGIGEVDLFASMNAAKEVGGDFYDFFPIDDDTVGFLIADVSGKGIPGALFMMAAKTEISNHMQSGIPLAQAIKRANTYLCSNNEAGMFVTVWAATLKWKTGELTYVNAGHNFPLLRHGQGGDWEWIKKKCGLFLGTFDIAKYRQETIKLEPGDELLLYTDGVNEAFNVAEEEYGNDQLEQFLADHADLRPEEMVRELRADVARWAEGAEQSDDVTILAVEYRLEG